MPKLSILNEFKTFALRGNVVDLAVGVIIGAAFGKVVSSLVSDIIMPPIGLLVGGVDFSSLGLTLKQATETSEAVSIKYGLFINTMIDFLIIAVVIFLGIKVINRLRGDTPTAASNKDCPECLMSIPLAAKKCGHCGSSLINEVKQ